MSWLDFPSAIQPYASRQQALPAFRIIADALKYRG
jgi:hypothetical protein